MRSFGMPEATAFVIPPRASISSMTSHARPASASVSAST
jgi:hypothetical protein